MLNSRKFHIVTVGENKGTGIDSTDSPDKIVEYNGEKIIIEPD
jgi:hypothetical protein